MLNRSLRFSVLLLLAVTLIANISIRYWWLRHNQIDPRWRTEVFYDCEDLENKPSVTVDALYRTGAKVTLSNTGHTMTCQELKGSCPVIQRQSRSLGLLSELLGKRRQLLFFGMTRARWEA